jgi:hypothetical protein
MQPRSTPSQNIPQNGMPISPDPARAAHCIPADDHTEYPPPSGSFFGGISHVARVLDAHADVERNPVSHAEEIFASLMIQHLNGASRALREKLVIKPDGLRRDVWWFFSLPVPLSVWNRVKVLHKDAFIAFIEQCGN